MALPVFGLFKKAPRDLSMWTDYPVKLTEPITLALVEPKVILLRTAVDFDLTPIFTSGELVPYEAASNTIRVDLTAEYDDGSVRNFTCDNHAWHYETRKCESHVVIGKDIVVYYCGNSCGSSPDQSHGDTDHITTVFIFKNVKESFGPKEL